MAGSNVAVGNNFLLLPHLAAPALRWALQSRRPVEEGAGTPRAQTAQTLRFQTYQHDPLGRLLIGWLKLNPFGLGFLGFLALLLVLLTAIFLYQYLLPRSVPAVLRFLSNEWAWLLANLVLSAVVPIFYGWMTRATGNLFADLYLDGAVEGEPRAVSGLILEGRRSPKGHLVDARWTWGAAGATLLFPPLWVLTGLGGRWAHTPYVGVDYWLFAAVITPFYTVLLYMFFTVLVREMAMVRALYRWFANSHPESAANGAKRLRPWHPDRCGGLGRLNNYAVHFSYFIAICGFGLVMLAYTSVRFNGVTGSLTQDPAIWLLVAIYVTGAPSLFFLTLGSAHQSMRQERTEHLQAISQQMDAEYQKIRSNLTADGASLAASIAKVKHLQEVYELTAKFPVWPFNLANVERFIAAVGSPIIVGVSVALSIEFFKRVSIL